MKGPLRGTNCTFQGHSAVLTELSCCRSTELLCALIPGSQLPSIQTDTLWEFWGELEISRGKSQRFWWRTAFLLPLSQKSRFVFVIRSSLFCSFPGSCFSKRATLLQLNIFVASGFLKAHFESWKFIIILVYFSGIFWVSGSIDTMDFQVKSDFNRIHLLWGEDYKLLIQIWVRLLRFFCL